MAAMEPGFLAQLAAERQRAPSAEGRGGRAGRGPHARGPAAPTPEPTGGGRRLRDGAEVAPAPAAKRAAVAASAPSPLDGILLSGVEDAPPAAARATEVDCRNWGAGFEAEGASSRVFRFTSGEGKLADRKGGDFERNVRHLTNSARAVADARGRGETVWVHCSMGMNRGPAGVMAYLLLHTEVPTLREAHRLLKAHDAHRGKAKCRSNTFARELEHICTAAGKAIE